MHRHVAHSRRHASIQAFGAAMLSALREAPPGTWQKQCDQVAGAVRVTDP